MSPSDPGDVACPHCGQTVPDREFCCRCGTTLAAEKKAHRFLGRRPHHYAAAPNEPAWALRFTSTLFPQLPHHDMVAFRIALMSGLALIVVLGVAGVFPIALAAAAVLVPLLTLLYLYTVDVYEDEPLLIVGFTMASGALAGVALGLILEHVAIPVQQHGLANLSVGAIALYVFAVPVATVLLALVGPLILLSHPRFNDVLDGVIFGAASAVALRSAMMLVTAWPIAELGLRPQQDAGSWTLRVVELGILMPLIAGGGVGWAAAALWARYRAPIGDRHALGPLGLPFTGVIVAAVFVVAAAFVQQTLGQLPRVLVLAVLAALGLLLLRRAIHIGLLEEADESEPGDEVTCANCGRQTPVHTFCACCGVALRALPKRPSPGETSTEP